MEQLDPQALKRARTTAIVFGVITSLWLITIVYGFVQKGVADENAKFAIEKAREAESLKIQLTNCIEEAKAQRQFSAKAMEEAVRARLQVEEQLKKLQK